MSTKKLQISSVSELLDAEIPERLWHYTSIGGLHGIVESASIFCTDVRFLNDSEELIHAQRLLKEIIFEEIRKLKNKDTGYVSHLKSGIEVLCDGIPFDPKVVQIFVACFSESKDQLSQWRGYSQQSSGTSLGFDLRATRGDPRYFGHLSPCIYEDGVKRKLIRSIVNEYIQDYSASWPDIRDGWDSTDEHVRKNAQSHLLNITMRGGLQMLGAAALMKHSSFNEECEWRWVRPITRVSEDRARVKFGVGNKSLIPRILQPLIEEHAHLREVDIGPGSHPSASAALDGFFSCRGMEVTIEESCIPYRPNG